MVEDSYGDGGGNGDSGASQNLILHSWLKMYAFLKWSFITIAGWSFCKLCVSVLIIVTREVAIEAIWTGDSGGLYVCPCEDDEQLEKKQGFDSKGPSAVVNTNVNFFHSSPGLIRATILAPITRRRKNASVQKAMLTVRIIPQPDQTLIVPANPGKKKMKISIFYPQMGSFSKHSITSYLVTGPESVHSM